MAWDFCFCRDLFFVVCLTYGCLRSWNRLCSVPMAFKILSCVRRKASGSYMVPVLGDGNRYGLRGCFLCSATSRSTACCGRASVRTELRVFGGLTTSSPLMRFTCFVTASIRFLARRHIHEKTNLPAGGAGRRSCAVPRRLRGNQRSPRHRHPLACLRR